MKTYNTYRDQMLAAADRGDLQAISDAGTCALIDMYITPTEFTQLYEMHTELIYAVLCGNGLC